MSTEILSCRIALDPTPLQQTYFWQWSGTSRFIYNHSLDMKITEYESTGIYLNSRDIMKRITKLKKDPSYDWMNETPSETIKYAVKDMEAAFKSFFRGSGYPKFKSRKRSIPSFYTRYDKIKTIDARHIQLCGTSRIKDKQSLIVRTLEKCQIPAKPLNPRIKYDGKYWYLTFGVEVTEENSHIPLVKRILKRQKMLSQKPQSPPLGIDLGIKNTAYLSTGRHYPNINTDIRIHKLEHRLLFLKQAVSKKYEAAKKMNGCYKKSRNIEKLERKIKRVYRSLRCKRTTLLHEITTETVKTKPSKIVIEDLGVSNMLQNHSLAKSIQEQKWYELRRQLEYKCRLYSISLETAPRTYPSSKLCSRCGHKKADLSLSDRTYVCEACGLTIDRDLNAAINLSRL